MFVSAFALLTGCTGVIGEAPASLSTDTLRCDTSRVYASLAPLRRLTRIEYDNTVRDLLFDATAPASSAFLPDPSVPGGFDTEAARQSSNAAIVERYQSVAEAVAARAVSQALSRIVTCDLKDPSCRHGWLRDFAARAFRRPLTNDELSRYEAFFESVPDKVSAVRLTLQAILQSPQFLYRVEPEPDGAQPGDIVPVDAYALASRISYALTRSMPDAALYAKAASGDLATAAGVANEARRLLSTDAARTAMRDFFEQWLRLAPLSAATRDDPRFTLELRRAMLEESFLFIDDAMWGGPGGLETLLAGTYSFVNRDLARLYGVPEPVGDGFARIALGAQRPGVLTRTAWLTVNAGPRTTKPVARGAFLRRELLCDTLGNPPPDAEQSTSNTGDASGMRSVRDGFTEHVTEQRCAACHVYMDDLGFAFDTFGPIGESRTRDDNGFAIDAAGALLESDVAPVGSDEPVPFHDATELMGMLAKSEKVAACVAQQQLEFHLGRTLKSDDACVLRGVAEAYRASDYDFRELLVALVASDAFRYRRIPKIEP